MILTTNIQTPNFQARNPVIRQVDDIARLTNRIFPVISSSKIKARAGHMHRFDSLYKRIGNEIGQNVRCHTTQPDSLARAMLIGSAMKKFKVGNCAELSRISNLICKVNGINALPFQFMVERNGRIIELDHMALIYPLKAFPQKTKKLSQSKDYIIIDPWLGFADYAPKAQERYNKDFKKLLKIGADEKLVINPKYISYKDKLFNTDIKLLKTKFAAWFRCFSLPKNLQK